MEAKKSKMKKWTGYVACVLLSSVLFSLIALAAIAAPDTGDKTKAGIKSVNGMHTLTGSWLKHASSVTSTPVPPSPPPVRTVQITFTGDLMVHQEQTDAAFVKETGDYNFDYSLSLVAPYLQKADLTVGNLETTFAGAAIGYSDFPMFNCPDQFGAALKRAGFGLLTTANNHANDKKEAGVLRTISVLDELGVDHVGTYTNEAARDTIYIKEINGIKFAFLSYTYGTNGIPTPEGKDYLINILDEARVQADITRAKALKPDFIIVLPHFGNEYELTPRAVFKNWVDMMLSAGADIVIASHPHVVQPMAFQSVTDDSGVTRDCFVAYSMGNFVSSQRTQPREAGLMLHMYFEKTGDSKAVIKNVTYTPTWVKFTDSNGKRDIIVLPVADVLQAYGAGEDVDLRPKDLNRLRAVHAEIAQTLLGYDIPAADMAKEYTLSRVDE